MHLIYWKDLRQEIETFESDLFNESTDPDLFFQHSSHALSLYWKELLGYSPGKKESRVSL